MMKQITADLKRLVKADPGKHQSVMIAAINQDVDVNFQYNGDGMYRCLLNAVVRLRGWNSQTSGWT